MGKRVGRFFLEQKLITVTNFLILLVLTVSLICVYVPLTYYWPKKVNKDLFMLAHDNTNDLMFFIEKQRRYVIELARSGYINQLISFAQDQSEITEQQIKEMKNFLRGYQESFGYRQIFLIDTDGTFIFSTIDDLVGQSIKKEEYQESSIHESFQLVRITLTAELSQFRYDPIVGQKSLFVSMPVSFQGRLIGFLVAQLDDERIRDILEEFSSLGHRGEFLIAENVDDHLSLVLSPRISPEQMIDGRPISAELRLPIEKAVNGFQGFGISTDYRGRKVASAWYFIPQLNWGLVAKIDFDQVMFYIRLLLYFIYFLILCLLIFVGFLAKRSINKKNKNSRSKTKKNRQKLKKK